MTKKDIFILFLPSFLFVAVTIGLIQIAVAIKPNEERTERRIAELATSASNSGAQADGLIAVARRSRLSKMELQSFVFRALLLSISGLLVALLVQGYTILRVASEQKRQFAKRPGAP